ncbi:MAG: hypothetical protein ACRC0U_00955 [Vibrio sp.]
MTAQVAVFLLVLKRHRALIYRWFPHPKWRINTERGRSNAPFLLLMLGNKKFWLSALAGVVIGFLITKGDRVTQFFGGLTATLGVIGLDNLALIVGIIFTVLSYITTTLLNWHWKNERHKLLKEHLANGEPIASLLDGED